MSREGPIPCPEFNLLAGFAVGSLLPAESAMMGAHVEACPRCREAVAAIRASEGPASADVGPARGRRPLMLAAAGLLVAAVGLASWLVTTAGDRVPRSTDEVLVSAAERLARERPSVFGGFRPLGPADRALREDPQRAPDAGRVWPGATILDRRPELRWDANGGGATWKVRLFRQADGARLLDTECAAPPLVLPSEVPDLAEGGEYLWEAVSDGPLGREERRAHFTVADAALRRIFEEARIATSALGPDEAGDLLLAHFACARRLFGEARRLAKSWSDAHPEDAVGRETLDLLRSLVGDPGSVPR